MIHSVGGQLNNRDKATRQSFGTVGGDHVINSTLSNNSMANIVDDQDPRIAYGRYASLFPGGPINITASRSTGTSYSNTSTQLSQEGACAQLHFSGTYIGIVATMFNQSMDILVLVDGKPTKGIGPGPTMALASDTINATHPLTADAMTIRLFSDVVATASWDLAGEIAIGSERITYDGISYDAGADISTLNVTARGANGTAPQVHSWDTVVHRMTERVRMSYGATSPIYATSMEVYRNPFIEPGDHTVTIIALNNAQGGTVLIFDGFTLAPLQTLSNVSRTYVNSRVTFTTDANGYYYFGNLILSGSLYVIGFMGHITTAGPDQVRYFCYNAGGTPGTAFLGTPGKAYTVEMHFSTVGATN